MLVIGRGGGLRVGDAAPPIEATTHQGLQLNLQKLLEDGPVVLYFYPRDETPGCTAQACAFRDAYEDFVDAGAQVIGVSSDGADSHRGFADRHGLPFPLISDTDGSLRQAFGVSRTFGLLPGRVTYVVGQDGIIHHVFSSQLRPDQHIPQALAVVGRLAGADEISADDLLRR